MADDPSVICDSSALGEGGKGVRFKVHTADGEQPAFAVRYNGKVYAYLNRCAHVPVEMDWMDGAFFDYSKLYLICATHGAMYLPDNGLCVQGPCPGKRLKPVAIEERDGLVLLMKEIQYV
jgi:nitrite reductase/ring-hydroxylating ferredoxin subunit